MEWVKLMLQFAIGIVTCAPLAYQLYKVTKSLIREKNWPELQSFILECMKAAESLFDCGEQRKDWVMTKVKAEADRINYNVDMEAVSGMIDAFAEMSKVVNVPAPDAEAI